MTGGRGPDAVVDAVGMEAHGSPGMKAIHKLVGLLPDAVAEPMMNTAGMDRMAALYSAFDILRRGGTVSLSGVYEGMADPLPMLTLFDKQVRLRMGQANVKRWVPDILPLLEDDDPLGVNSFAGPGGPASRSVAFVERLSATTRASYLALADGKHAMLRSGRRFDRYAAEFTAAVLLGDAPSVSDPVARALEVRVRKSTRLAVEARRVVVGAQERGRRRFASSTRS